MSTAKMFQYLASLGYQGSLSDKWNAYFSDLLANGGQPDIPTSGEYIPDRDSWNSGGPATLASGVIYLSFFTARRSEVISNVAAHTGGVAAGATPTLCRYGIFSVAANGDLTLVASTPNDTALWSATFTAYPKALSVPLNKVAGQRYAVGVLGVTGAAMPSFAGEVVSNAANVTYGMMLAAPTLIARLGGQTDLPASISAGSLVGFNHRPGFILT